jgi:hypothetical protein
MEQASWAESASVVGSKRLGVALSVCAGVAGLSAAAVFLFGVIFTSGVYSSRVAWLLGVVVPLLGGAALFAWLSSKMMTREAPRKGLRTMALVCLGLISIPIALALLGLFVHLLLFATG